MHIPFVNDGSWKEDDVTTVYLWIAKFETEPEIAANTNKLWGLYSHNFSSPEKSFELLKPFIAKIELKQIIAPAVANSLSLWEDDFDTGLSNVTSHYQASFPSSEDEEDNQDLIDARVGVAAVLGASGKILSEKATKDLFEFLASTFGDESDVVREMMLQAGLGKASVCCFFAMIVSFFSLFILFYFFLIIGFIFLWFFL